MRSRTWLWTTVALAGLLGACSGGSGCGGKRGPHATSATPSAITSAPPIVGSRLDDLLREAWKQQGLTPTAPADDATFLRRASLDLLGALPPPEQVVAFEADAKPDKRARAVDAMLADPRFSERFATVWTDLLIGQVKAVSGVDPASFRSWLRARMQERAPWDSIVRDIVSAEGRNSPGGDRKDRVLAAMSSTIEPEVKGVTGAVNYPLRYRDMIEDLAGKTSRTFLGVQLQCAQCHDHKTEKWTMAEFRGFAAAFAKTRGTVEDRGKKEMAVIEVKDAPRARPRPKATDSQKAIAAAAPKALDGTALDADHPRAALAKWMTDKANPYFAKAFVNRVWGSLLGSGFVNPIDDLRPGNPAELPAALDLLASDFTAGNFDVRRLYRSVCLSEAYQRSAGPDAKLWASFALAPLPADVLLDAVVSATGLGPLLEDVAGERADLIRAKTKQRFMLVLDVDEDAGNHSFEGSIAQALLLSNGAVTRAGASNVDGGALEKIVRGPGSDEQKIASLYLRTLSRRPTAAELSEWKKVLDEAGNGPAEKGAPFAGGGSKKADPLGALAGKLRSRAKTAREQAYEDLFWALLNSSEMAFRH